METRRVTIPMNGDAIERTPTVLLVTGDADLRAVIARVLTRVGYHVIPAAHSGHALLAGRTGRIDFLISELELDETSGSRLAATLRQHHPGVRAVYLADAGTPAADGVLVRPFTRDALVLMLDAGALATSAS